MLGLFNYQNNERFTAKIELDNKIRKDFHVLLDIQQDKSNEENIVATYLVQGLLESKVKDHNRYNFKFNVNPSGKSISSNMLIEKLNNNTNFQNLKILEVALDLVHDESSNFDYDYAVALNANSKNGNLKLDGKIIGSLFQSKIDLSALFKGEKYSMTSPLRLVSGHSYDGSEDAKSYVEFHLEAKDFSLNHGGKLIFVIDAQKRLIQYIELQIPRADKQPLSLFYQRSSNADTSVKVSYGLLNAEINLADSNSSVAQTLIRADDQTILRSLVFEYSKEYNAKLKKTFYGINAKKNNNTFVFVNLAYLGDVEELRVYSSELPRQVIGFDLSARVLENSGKVFAQADLESSAKKNLHNFEFEFKSENFFRLLLRVISISAKFKLNKSNVDAKAELTKIGDVKSYKITSSGNLRNVGEWKEFNVNYEKKLANGKSITGAGLAKFKFTDFKNFQSNVEIKKHFTSSFNVENVRKNKDAMFGTHNFNFNMKHLDVETNEQDYKVLIHNITDTNSFKFLLLARDGELNSLENRDKVSFLVKLNYEKVFTKEDSVRALNRNLALSLKSKRFNVDTDNNLSLSRDTKLNTNLNVDSDSKFPTVITDPGKSNMLKTSLKYNKLNKKSSVNFNYETDNVILMKVFRKLSIEGNVLEKKANMSEGAINIAYQLGMYDAGSEAKSYKVKFDSDMSFYPGELKVNVKQNILKQYQSYFKRNHKIGEIIKIDDCTLMSKAQADESTRQRYSFDASFKIECNGKGFTNSKFVLKQTLKNSTATASKAEFSTASEIFNLTRSLDVNLEHFTDKQGSIELTHKNGNKLTASKFAYLHEIDQKTSKIEKAKYKTSLSSGDAAKEECELNIEYKNDYYNSLSCKLNSKEVKGIELKYGYNLKVDNPKEFDLGRRGIQLDLIVPARTIKVTYKSNFDYVIDGINDQNDEREFNTTMTLHWNFVKEPTKMLTLSLKKENYAKGKTLSYVEVTNSPSFKVLRVEYNKIRLFNETSHRTSVMYELNNSRKNRFDFDTKLRSDSETNAISLEANLERPKVNTFYENRFNKNNGSLEHLSIRLAKLIRFSVENEFDPVNRRISMSLFNPDDANFSLEKSEKFENNIFKVESQLKTKSSILSTMVSTFDSKNNKLNVLVDAKKSGASYEFDFGIFNETLANAVVSKNGNAVGIASISIGAQKNLVFLLKWNRIWNEMKRDILGENELKNKDAESHFGRVYSVLAEDLNPIAEYNKQEREAILNDLKNFALIRLQFLTSFIPEEYKDNVESLKARYSKYVLPSFEPTPQSSATDYRLAERYNELVAKLSTLDNQAQNSFQMLSNAVPTLPEVEYNKVNNSNFEHNLVISQKLKLSRNLYQLATAIRNRQKETADRMLQSKGDLATNPIGLSYKAIINKYKFRSLNDYTLVASVYNRRNIIGFDGEHKVLQSKCRYLLAHELHKNRFSVVLNFNENAYPLSVFAYGGKSFDLSYDRAAIDGKPVSLPHSLKIADKGVVSIRRTNVGVCVEVNNDLKVCCYEDSFSCTIAVTRWFSGKIDGLLGRADNNPEVISDANWFLQSSCKAPTSILKKSNDDAVSTCFNLFGQHKNSLYVDAFQVLLY